MSDDRVRNLLDLELEGADQDFPEHHRFSGERVTELVGSVATGMSVYELDPGIAGWPYHFELNEEEWLIVIAGEVVLRTPEGEQRLRAGDVACFPAGAAGAHAVRNESEETARFAMPSTNARFGGATVYLDSGKVSVYGPGYRHRGWLGERVPYWEGEP